MRGLADLGAPAAVLGAPAGWRATTALAFSADGRQLAAAEAAPGRRIAVFAWREVLWARASGVPLPPAALRASQQHRLRSIRLAATAARCLQRQASCMLVLAVRLHLVGRRRIRPLHTLGPLRRRAMWARRMQGVLEAVAQGPWPAAALSFCPADGGRLAALGAGALALWRLRTLLGAPELTFDLAATPGAREPAPDLAGTPSGAPGFSSAGRRTTCGPAGGHAVRAAAALTLRAAQGCSRRAMPGTMARCSAGALRGSC